MAEDLTRKKQTLAAMRLLRQRNRAADSTTSLRRREVDQAPLSFPQARLWFLNQLDPENTAYNGTQSLRFEGILDRRALESSFNAIIARHEPLRTRFESVNGQAFQIVADDVYIALAMIDLTEVSEKQKWELVQKYAVDQERQPFNLAEGPLIRAALLCLQPSDHVL